jgi:hypothetical protein
MRSRHRRSFRHHFYESLERRQLLAADLVISEFLANNENGIVDGYGEASDWIEIHNAGEEPADLAGFHLTDSPVAPGKWTFPPQLQLASDEYLVVFASGRDGLDPAGNLHSNFRLSTDGEYVALTNASMQVLSDYGSASANYPAQVADVSYGIHVARSDHTLVDPHSPAHVLAAHDNLLQDQWYLPEFAVDGAWQSGPAAIGFDRLADQGVPVSGGTAVLQVDFGDDDSGESGEADTEAGWHSMTLSDNGSIVDGVTVTLSAIGNVPLDDRDRTIPIDNPPGLTVDQLFDDMIFASSQTDDTGLEIQLSGLIPGQVYETTLWSYDAGSVSPRVSTWTEVSGETPVEIESTYQFDGNLAPQSDLDNTMTALLTASTNGELRIQGRRNGGTSYGVFINALQLVVPSISSAIEHDVGALMADQASSAYLRIPFPALGAITGDDLTLAMQYDSGFVAYLNGSEVTRRNAPSGSPLGHDAVALAERDASSTLARESIDLSDHLALLRTDQTNVLAIQGLNSSAAQHDFLVRPELVLRELGVEQIRYLAEPSPGAANTGDAYADKVADTAFSVDRGFYDAAQNVVVTTPTPGASLIYTLDGSLPTGTNGLRVDAPSANQPPAATIPIATTTYLRAVAIKDGYLPTNVDTHSYIFLNDVIQQDVTPETGEPSYPATWQSPNYQADYQMDPDVVEQWDDHRAQNQDFGIREALQSIPTMSVVMNHDDLWDSRSGIYPRAQSQGSFWRRPGSVEYIDPDTGEQFQVNAGIQIHGGASRDNERTKKHSFRLVFNEDFGGPSQLNFPLFQQSTVDQINTIVLKSFFTDGFPTRTATGRYSPLDSQYLRDTWMRDVRLAMGGLEAHSEYVHLYINGLYWGLYSPTERPDEAFLASYLGGERDDYDIIKDFNELFRGERTAWNEMFEIANGGLESNQAYQRIQGNNPDGSSNPDLPNYLDVDDLIDFMILHLYGGAEDWPHHNWYAGRNRSGDTTGFRFFTWDQEIVLDGRFRNRINVNDAFTPARLYARLRQNEEFNLRFADRVYQHLFNDGALATDNTQSIWMRRADQIEAALIAESARWGDAREGEVRRIDDRGPNVTIPVMTVDLWRAERDNVRDNYFPQSHQLAIERFRSAGLFPTTPPPLFSQRGGLVSRSTDIHLNGLGQIYYTLDGSDPREQGGGISPSAVLYDGAFQLSEDTSVTVRTLQGGQWSPLDLARFEVDKVAADATNFRISEIHYRPAGDEDLEFIEWVNLGTQPLSLTNVRVAGGVTFDFNTGAMSSLSAGQRLLLVRDAEVFAQRYPQASGQVAGVYQGALSNGGESLSVFAEGNVLIQTLSYDDDVARGWPALSDGRGHSLQALDPRTNCPTEANCNWRPSAVPGGTPGQAEYPVGDANLDGKFNSSDLVLVFQTGKYENTAAGIPGWQDGDWNGDGLFGTSDLVFAFQQGTYIAAAIACEFSNRGKK